MVGLWEFLLATTIIEEYLRTDGMSDGVSDGVLDRSPVWIAVNEGIWQLKIGVGREFRRRHHWAHQMKCLTALLTAYPTDPQTLV
jgi:hypothetical protein